MDARLDEIRDAALAELGGAADLAALRAVERRVLGKDGELTLVLRGLGGMPKAERPAFGKAVNELKAEVADALAQKKRALADRELARELEGGAFDATEPGKRPDAGNLHPITRLTDELVEVFCGLGFACLDGPEVELEYYNFDALNIPKDHPARDAQDTFWLEDGNLLRTHTSPVQVRAMERLTPPLAVVVPGRCFRNETVDASHDHSFYQMEGLMIDREISVAHLIHTMKTALAEILRREVEVRLRPGFFPFVEPGFELDVDCPFCEHGTRRSEQGATLCGVCKATGWIELLPCGMVHPRVLEAGGLDPEDWTGFAFGLGLQRLVMVRYSIGDIRDFWGGDLRFVSQFGAGA